MVKEISAQAQTRLLSITWLGTTWILYHGILQSRFPQCRDLSYVAMIIFVVVSDVNNGVMTKPAVNNGHDDVTELPVTSHWFGML